MTLNLTFFDKIKYKSTDFIARDSDFFGAGVVHTTDFPLTYPATPNMTVSVGSGTAWVNGYRVANDSNLVSLTFTTADSTNPRIDIIQVGYTASTDSNGDTTGNAVLQIKQGVAQASPIEPGADPGFVKLYAVSIAAKQTTVTAANVTDRRALVPLNVDGSQITNFAGATLAQLQSLTADLFGDTSVVLSGGTATKDVSVATQLDVTSANVYFGEGQHVNFSASQNGQFKTTAVSSTYYLDYNSDSTTSWGTSHSTQSGYVPIAQVTTDASGNISTVTDERPLTVELFNQASKVDGSKLVNLPLPTDLAKTDADNAFSAKQTFDAGFDLPSGQTGTVEGTLEAGTGGVIHATNSDDLDGQPASNYLRIDSGAPGTQTVMNGVDFNQGWASNVGATAHMGYGNVKPSSETDINWGAGTVSTSNPQFTWSGLRYDSNGKWSNFQGFYYDGTNYLVALQFDYNGGKPITKTFNNTLDDGSGNMTVVGNISASSGQLGSASGTWTPASGSLNVAAGTVINVAAVPSGAKMWFASGAMWGITTPSGSAWAITEGTSGTYVYVGSVSSMSAVYSGSYPYRVNDGTYFADGYFQVNGGYLQFVVTTSGTSTSGASNVKWAVS